MKSKILVFYNLNLVNIFFSIFLKVFFFRKIFYLTSSSILRGKIITETLNRFNIELFSYNNFIVQDNFIIHTHIEKLSEDIINSLNDPIVNTIENEIDSFCDNKKFKNYFKKFFVAKLHTHILHYIEFKNVINFLKKDNNIITYNNNFFFNFFAKKTHYNFSFDTSYFGLIQLLFSKLFLIFISILKKIKNKFFIKPKINSTIKKSYKNCIVAFFPHKGLYYSNLYTKDYFYSENPNSIFNKQNILHFFYKEYLDDKSIKFAEDNNINYIDWFNNFSIKDKIKIYFHLLKIVLSNFKIFIIEFKFTLISFFYLYSIFINSIQITKRDNLKFYLTGFDILFPKDLSLALKLHNKITIGNQDRLLSQWWSPINYFTYYFSYGDDSDNKLKNKFYSNGIFPIGSIRTNHYLKTKSLHKNSNFKYQILISDQSLSFDYYQSSRSWGSNYISNKIFYGSI